MNTRSSFSSELDLFDLSFRPILVKYPAYEFPAICAISASPVLFQILLLPNRQDLHRIVRVSWTGR